MAEVSLRIIAFAAPALLGVVAAFVGRKSVSKLREKTGDDSALTGVLSGDLFNRNEHREAA